MGEKYQEGNARDNKPKGHINFVITELFEGSQEKEALALALHFFISN